MLSLKTAILVCIQTAEGHYESPEKDVYWGLRCKKVIFTASSRTSEPMFSPFLFNCECMVLEKTIETAAVSALIQATKLDYLVHIVSSHSEQTLQDGKSG